MIAPATAPAPATDEERIRLHEVLSDDHGLTLARAKKLHGAILAAGFRLAPVESDGELNWLGALNKTADEAKFEKAAASYVRARLAASHPASTPAAIPRQSEQEGKGWSHAIKMAAARHVLNNAVIPPADDKEPSR